MSAMGHKRTLELARVMSALPPKADIQWLYRHVRFVPIADSCSAAKKRYSITSSARPSNVTGKVMPSALAVLRLMTNSTFTACWIGRSAGLLPLRIFPA